MALVSDTPAPAPEQGPAPVLAPGVELLGTVDGSGYQQQPGLVRGQGGQTIQVTPLLYELLGIIDGRRTAADLADELRRRTSKNVTPADVETLLDTKLAPLGLVGPEVQTETAPTPLLALRPKFVISDPAVTGKVTAPFAALFRPWIVIPVLIAFAVTCWWVLWRHGLAAATRQAFDSPGLLLTIFVLTLVSAGWHEFGHAAACRAKDAKPGAMGAGLYLVWPAFYTDVSDSYRLRRWGRLVVDLGGLYFNAIVAVGAAAFWMVTRQHAVLLLVALQMLLMLRQLAPFVRADGYHILADLTGVPDLFQHIKPTLSGLLPTNWGKPQPLRPAARWLVRAWVLIVVPLLIWLLLIGVLLLPRLVATAWVSLKQQAGGIADNGFDVLGVLAGSLRIVALLLPIAAILYQAVRIGRRAARSVWSRTDGRPVARTLAATAAVVIFALLALAWWPVGQYEPVAANERGTIQDTRRIVRPRAAPADIRQRVAPRTAFALVPRGGGPALLLTRNNDGGAEGIVTTGDRTGVAFPFALPESPGPGDNQALAVNTADGTVVYDVAVALVWVTDGDAALNRNEAYALASCADCTTVAVAFQVVLVVGQSDVIAPINAAVAGNNDCLRCSTSALAVQLVLTLRELPSDELRQQIEAAVGRAGGVLGTADPVGYLLDLEAEIVGLLSDADLVDNVASTGATATSTASTVAASTTTAPATTVATAVTTTEPSTTTTSTPSTPSTTGAPTTTSPVDAG